MTNEYPPIYCERVMAIDEQVTNIISNVRDTLEVKANFTIPSPYFTDQWEYCKGVKFEDGKAIAIRFAQEDKMSDSEVLRINWDTMDLYDKALIADAIIEAKKK